MDSVYFRVVREIFVIVNVIFIIVRLINRAFLSGVYWCGMIMVDNGSWWGRGWGSRSRSRSRMWSNRSRDRCRPTRARS